MNAQQVIALLVQVIGLAQTLTPAALQAVADFKRLFDDQTDPTQEDFDALLSRLKSQSDQIQAID